MTEIIVRALDEDAGTSTAPCGWPRWRSRRRRSWPRYEEEAALDEAVLARADAALPAPGGRARRARPSAWPASAGPAHEETTPASSSGSGSRPPSGGPVSQAPVQAGADAGPRRRPHPPRLLGGHGQRPRGGLCQRVRLPAHGHPPPHAGAQREPTRRRSPWCSRWATTAGSPSPPWPTGAARPLALGGVRAARPAARSARSGR